MHQFSRLIPRDTVRDALVVGKPMSSGHFHIKHFGSFDNG